MAKLNPIKIYDSVCVNFTIKSEKEIEVNINENDEICKDVIKNRKFVRSKALSYKCNSDLIKFEKEIEVIF